MSTALCLLLIWLLSTGPVGVSTSIGGPGIDVTGEILVPNGPGFAALLFVSDWDISFGDPWLAGLDSSASVTAADRLCEDLRVSRDLETAGPVVLLPDGSILVAAFGEPRATGRDADACVMKIRPDGGRDWAAVLGREDEEVYRIAGLGLFGDGAFLVAGTSGCGAVKPFCRIYSGSGLYCSEVAFPDTLAPVAAAGTPEGSVVVAAMSSPGTFVLMWIDRQGRMVRLAGLDQAAAQSPDAMVETMSVGCSGRIYLCGSSYPNPWICCLAPNGGYLWSAIWDGEGRITDIEETGRGGVACCGCTGLGNSRMSAVLTLYSRDGSLLWRRLYEDGEYSSFENMTVLEDGGFLLAGSCDLSGSDDVGSEAFLVSTGPDGLPDLEQPGDGPAGRGGTRFQSLFQPSGTIVACGVYDSPEEACESAAHAADAADLEPGVLWIPDYPSLSGSEGWLAYLVPETVDGNGWTELCTVLQSGWPDAYLVWVGYGMENSRRALLP